MRAYDLAKILLENPDVEVSIRIFDDDHEFEVLSSDENILLLVEFPEEEPEDTRMFI